MLSHQIFSAQLTNDVNMYDGNDDDDDRDEVDNHTEYAGKT